MSDEELEAKQARTADPRRGQVLPLYKNEDGSVDFAWPQWALDAYNSLTLPRDTIMAELQPTEEDIINFAGMIGLGGTAASTALSPDADLGMFLGSKAQSANLEALKKAADMKNQGATREDIWDQTGWWEAPDGNWVWELDDSKLDLTPKVKAFLEDPNTPGVEGATKKIIDHPTLFDEYGYENDKVEPIADPYKEEDGYDPNTQSTVWRDIDPRVAVGKREKGLEGYFDPSVKKIHAEGENIEVIKDTLVHELQHAVQQAEGMAVGTSMEDVEKVKARIAKSLPTIVNDYWKVENTFRDIIENNRNTSRDYADSLIKQKLDFEDKFGPELTAEIQDVINFVNTPIYDTYRSHAGELLAETAANRRELSVDDRKHVFPWNHIPGGHMSEKQAWTPKTIANKVGNLLKTLAEGGFE